VTDLSVSIVIVSRGRPDALKRCLTGISQLQYPRFEVLVVSDAAGLAAARGMALGEHLKMLAFDVPNISAARNLGVEHAAGDIVAFIDDDAVPEPQWLRHLVAPAAQADVAAMGGFVRGRNGISYQWRARSLDALGEAQALDVDPVRATVLHPPTGHAVKTEGTNMAFRREVLIALGGFDTAFHYFLDETDLNMRLARAGHATVIVPLAEVHHGFAANSIRNRNRVPRDLYDIGASWAVFQRKHVKLSSREDQWHRLRKEQRTRLLRHLVEGGLEPRDVRRLMRRLDDGYAAGEARPLGATQLAAHPRAPFQAFPARIRKSVFVATRPIHAARDHARAVARVREGEIVTLLNLSPTALFHHVVFGEDGVWVQQGGVFGRAKRSEPLICLTTRRRRIKKERLRVANQRCLGE